jgi:hypothetical protein
MEICAAVARNDADAFAGSKSESIIRVPVMLTSRSNSTRGIREARAIPPENAMIANTVLMDTNNF